MWNKFRVLQLVLLGLVASPSSCDIAHYYTYEEEAPGTVIALLSEHPMFNSTDNLGGSFRLMKQLNSSLVRVRESDGQLSIGERIDREQICQRSLHCILALDVVSFSREQFKLIHVEVEVRDINDNSPEFPRAEIPVAVSESAQVGTRIPLEVAMDEDVGSNSIQSFQISVNSHFSLDVQSRADGVKYADLVLMKELDRESQSSYTLELVAMDGGSPSRSGTAVLHVNVLDFNDNSPAFERSAVTVELMEDAPIGHLLLELHAVDPDEGVNGDIVYGFSPQVSPEVRQLFQIDPKSGRLTLEGQVDFESKQTYEFDVQAQDLAPNPLAATCKIIAHILDVNDNAPAISITPLTSISAGVAYITEAAAKDSFVALISTTDSDSGPNGQVRCTLYGHEHFKLQQAYEDSFMIVTTSALDREKIAEYNLTVLAEDLGSPPFKSTKHYTIRLSDENDNAPVFAKPVYEVSVMENNAPGAYITTVLARDPDLGHNAKLTYRLLEHNVLGQAVSTFLALDSGSGVLRALRPLDYEQLKEIAVEIQASDSGTPELSTRAQVKVKLVDQNDNPPMIIYPLLLNGTADILLPITAPPNHRLLQVRARDADEGLNSQLSYTIMRDTHRLFVISRETGEVSLRRRVDWLQGGDLSIVIAVYDNGRPSLFCNATIRFTLTDSTPASVEMVLLEPSSEEQQLDLTIIFIAVLSGGCCLLLVAITFVACNCKRKSDPCKVDEHRIYREEQVLSNTCPKSASSTSSVSQPDSCQHSINTESEHCSVSQQSADSNQGSVASDPTSGWHEDKSVKSTSGNSHNEQHSIRDSGKGDSDSNDSDSDTSGEALKKSCDQTTQLQAVPEYSEAARMYRSPERYYSYQRNNTATSGNYTMHYEKGYTVSYPLASNYYNTYHPRVPNVNVPHHNTKDSYYYINMPRAEISQGEYERLMSTRGGTLSPPRVSRTYQETYNTDITLQTNPSEIATTF